MIFKTKAFSIFAGFLIFLIQSVFGQDQKLADSLALIYQTDKLQGISKLQLLNDLSFNENRDFQLSLKYAEELIALSQVEANDKFLAAGFRQKGAAQRQLGNLESAIDAFFIGAKIAIKINDPEQEGSAYVAVADVYGVMGNYDNAEIYYTKAIELFRKNNDSLRLASALLNAGDAYFNNKKYDAALSNFEESGRIFTKIDYLSGTAYNIGNVGMVYAEQRKDSLAELNINEAIVKLEEMEDYYPISVYLMYMSDIYLRKNNWKAALDYSKKSLELSEKFNLKDQISAANLQLSQLYEQVGNYKASNQYYKDHIVYRDSVKNLEAIQKMADVRTNYELSQKKIETDAEIAQKQAEVDLLNQKQRNQKIITFSTSIALVSLGILAFGLYRRNTYIKKTNQIIATEKNHSDKLLLNILPEEIAKELKQNGTVQAKKFESVTVLFTDFQNFTTYSENLAPEKLVESVGIYFSKFDEIIDKYGLEKIKTIGDAYMCAGGLPFQTKDHHLKIVLAAFEIAEYVKTLKDSDDINQMHFDIRLGVNTGPVVAGVVGTKKFAYDIWGDTVNIASRMESNSKPGKINVSENTYALIKDLFECEYRGEIEVKNKGKMKMYFANRIKNKDTINHLLKQADHK